MYIPYRKAYLSGMNPLSFVTIFTVGELVTMLRAGAGIRWRRARDAVFHSPAVVPLLFWLFLGGFVWVIGDIFQQFATKYLGIGRGIPLSNTNQLWGLAWGALVFGELAAADAAHRLLVIGGSLAMIAAPRRQHCRRHRTREHANCPGHPARVRPLRPGPACRSGTRFPRRCTARHRQREWWDWLDSGAAAGVFVWLGTQCARARVGHEL